jgi:hypothetical protein
MSLLTALLAFVPALAARKVEEPLLELPQVGEDLEHALADAHHQIDALSIELEALRCENRAIMGMVRHDLVRSANLPLPALPPEFTPLQQAAQKVQAEVMGRMLAGQAQMQALNSQMNVFANGPGVVVDWSACTCVPARADALRRGILGGLNI